MKNAKATATSYENIGARMASATAHTRPTSGQDADAALPALYKPANGSKLHPFYIGAERRAAGETWREYLCHLRVQQPI